MTQVINNPDIPHISAIDDGLGPGTLIRIQGYTPPTAQRFNINLQCGPNVSPRDDIALHIAVRVPEAYIARNTLDKQMWGEEQGQGVNPIGPAQQFEIIILCDQTLYKIAVNGRHFCEFPHRIPYHRVSHITIDGDVSIKAINFELVPTPKQPQSMGQQPPQQTPSGMYGPPPGNQTYGGPPQYGPPQGQYGPAPGQYGPPQGQYGPPPQGQYGPPQGQYGPPQGPYGPPPPPNAPGYNQSQEQEKSGFGFDGFLGQAGAALAGAFGSAVLQGALSGKQNPAQPVPQQPAAPQQPFAGGYGGQSVGGLGSIGSFLTDALTNTILPKQQKKKQYRKQLKKQQKKERKEYKKALKLGGPAAGIGFGAILTHKALKKQHKLKKKHKKHGHSSSSSSSSSDSD